jgi:dTDP-4-dehydrorhamnose 3,5-epimerase
MNVTATPLPGVLIIEPKVFEDARGWFCESYNERRFAESVCDVRFVQDNQSKSHAGVLRGLHYQVGRPQGKLVQVLEGEIFDVAVDIRKSSPTFGRWAGVTLSAANRRQMWIPVGFAHGFVVTGGEPAEVLYKTTDYWAPECERCIRWDDPVIGIEWPVATPMLSDKDRNGKSLAEAEVFP